MIRMLLWKEWREQRWKLAFGCVILMSFAALGLQTRVVPDIGIVVASVLGGAVVLPILFAMGVVAPEREEGSLRSLLALPVSPWAILAIKTGVGALVCVTPLAGSLVLVCTIAGGREVPIVQILYLQGSAVGLALTLFVWTLAFGIRQPSEARAGLVGVAVIGLWFMVALANDAIRWPPNESWLTLMHPFSFVDTGDHPVDLLRMAKVAVIQACMATGLWIWAASRFAREAGGQT